MRIIEFIAKLILTWFALVLLFRVPIFTGLVSETDDLDLWILVAAGITSTFLIWFAVVRRTLASRYIVLGLVAGLAYLLAAIVYFYPTYYAWNKHGFWGATAAFFLPGFSHIWANYINIRQGMWDYTMLMVAAGIMQIFLEWFRIRD